MTFLATMCSVVRMTAFISSFAFIQLISLTLVPVTFLNPFLRKCGVGERNLLMNRLMPLFARFVLFSSGVRLDVVDLASKHAASQVIYMYNHTSNLDPIIVQSVAACKFIFKKELRYVPLFGWVMFAYKHISIDRKNRAQAIESLNKAVRNVVDKKQNVAISPEGTRSKSGQLQEFKKGPFHMASQAHATIVPVVITGVHPILPPKSFLLNGGHVFVKLLPPVTMEQGETVEALQERVRNMFVEALENAKKEAPRQPQHIFLSTLPSVVVLFGLYRLATMACAIIT
jgi:1-acyl-sn-glycerol-3-phosphate acyltransferase